ncbi:MAG: hypothetical protein H6557_15760 [Lewinellaceae bacterium]|nr:hypothetical protein [Phaeodactylibacter sp.]MCB9038073.1 hypothetical protein [Lewinellaceae bacterium]
MKNQIFRMHTLNWVILVALMTVGSAVKLIAQESTEEDKKARISLDFFSINNREQKLVATVKTKVEGFFENVAGVKISFYKGEASEENLLGSRETDMNGKATLAFSPKSDTALWFTYIAVLENVPGYKDAEKEVEAKKAVLEFTTEEMDSVRTVNIVVTAPDSAGNMAPVADVNARLFVKRLFGALPVSDEMETTDEDGALSVEFPSDIPGDKDGNLLLVARVSDHEEFGNLEFSKTVPWGQAVQLDQSKQMKELWLSSSNTYKGFLIIVNLMLLGVVGVIVYIIRQLMQIKKLGLEGSSE